MTVGTGPPPGHPSRAVARNLRHQWSTRPGPLRISGLTGVGLILARLLSTGPSWSQPGWDVTIAVVVLGLLWTVGVEVTAWTALRPRRRGQQWHAISTRGGVAVLVGTVRTDGSWRLGELFSTSGGIGERLARHVVQIADDAQVPWLHCLAANRRLADLYEDVGFRQCGRRRGLLIPMRRQHPAPSVDTPHAG